MAYKNWAVGRRHSEYASGIERFGVEYKLFQAVFEVFFRPSEAI